MSTEADTCRTYIVPKLHAAGWEDDFIAEQRVITPGRIVPLGRKHTRREPRRPDYILFLDLLGTMNLILHGIEAPNIRRTNALDKPLKEIGEDDRFDIIVTNPPFGSEEEAGIQLNFPEATRTSETALLFLQFIMRSLKPKGRCAVVVPNGTLFGDGVAAKVKAKLLTEFNLHTIVRLPNGVFAPTRRFPQICCFSIAPGRQRTSGITNSPCLMGARTTARQNPCNMRSLPRAQRGGMSAKKTNARGRSSPAT